MKKILALVLAFVMIFALCGVASADNSAEVKIGLICLHDENSGYDANFINAFKAACEAAGVEGVIKTNIPETADAYDAACELADDGCLAVISDSYGHQSYMLEAANEYPDVQFTSCTGDMALAEAVENYHNAFASIYEARFLAGVAAGLKINEMIANGDITADEAKMGYVGAMTYAEVKSGYTSFYLGAKSVCPTVTMEVVFTGSWYDETLENEGANKLIQNGCVLISQHADSMGAPNACETAKVPNVSYNGSTQEACPNSYIISSRINWEPYFTYVITALQNGENYDTDWTGTLETNSVVLTELNEAVAAEGNRLVVLSENNEAVAAEGTAAKLEEVKAALLDGSVKVFDTTAWTVGGEAMTQAYALDTDGDWVPDSEEAIHDGAFYESEFRSAPYFAIDIDGITLLDQ